MTRPLGIYLSAALLTTLSVAQAQEKREIPVQVGGYIIEPGEKQNIGVQGLDGDIYTISRGITGNALLGLGLYTEALTTETYSILYGVNGFYLFGTQVSGTVVQEHEFENLSYQYDLSFLPVYLAVKGLFHLQDKKYALTADAGVGADLIFASSYKEHSLDGVTLLNHAFKGDTSVNFSAMLGLGIRVNQLLGPYPLECGYRFFYLGQGDLQTNNSQVMNNLSTGANYANALLCSATF